ncbi:iron transporter [Bordetella trematum]|uniref:iron transporter n=1 Tax=Bordetella trematum TaxID=123899 RepID=UPI000D9CD168|nr:iron transporter [Bordetella trematum]SPU54351.1 Uncharacterised protein [Bordetella trematum]VDH02847.1 Uncharacterised protein [Bordetella trematum]
MNKFHATWAVTSRSLAGVVGGYAVLLALRFALRPLLDAGEAARSVVLLGFLIYPTCILASFGLRSAGRAWAVVACLCAVLTAAGLLAGGRA